MTLLNNLFQPKSLSFKKNRLYRQSRIDFYEGRNSLIRLSSLKNLLFGDRIHSSSSAKQIQIQNLPFGASCKEIEKLKGKPNHVQKEGLALQQITTLFYREKIYGVTCIIQLQFFNDQFFFGTVELRYNELSFGEKIEQMIKEKYGIDQLINNSLSDTDGNMIVFNNSLIPTISYFSGNVALKESIKESIDRFESSTEKKSIHRSSKILDLI